MSIQQPQDYAQLSDRVEDLNARLDRLEGAQGIIVPIASFAPEPFEALKEIRAVVRGSGDDFQATFFDANISASGDNETESVENLKDLVLAKFAYLSEQAPETLGPAMKKQIAVLKEFVRRKD